MAVRTDKKKSEIDKELEKLIKARQPRIKVVGTGGAGNNTITRLMQVGIVGAETIAMNTDAQDLLFSDADVKVLLGRELTKGFGAGGDPKIGEEAAKESKDEIKRVLEGSDMVFVTCGLGGGTGTGSAPVIANIARKLGALTIGVVTLPFSMEGKQRMENARVGLEKLSKEVDTLIVIPNDRLLEIVPDVSLAAAFKVCDEILVNAVKGITELITKPGLVNLDFADVRAVMSNGGMALIGLGESDTENRAIEAVEKALSNPLVVADIEDAKGALINVVGGPDITIRESQEIVESVASRLSEDAKIIWGTQIDKNLEKTIRVLTVITGVSFPDVDELFQQQPSRKLKKKEPSELERELGIEFLE